MSESPVDVWYRTLCLSRARMGVLVPPFRWRYLLHWWAWRLYVLRR